MINRVKHILFFLLVLSFDNAVSQNLKADSLQKVLTYVKYDSLKVEVLNQLFLEYEFDDQEKACDYLKDALEISNKSGYKKGLAMTYIHYGFFYEDNGNFSEALEMYFKALEINLSINNIQGVGSAYNNIGIVFKNQGNFPEALKYYFEALKIREKMGDKINISSTYNNIGNVYDAQGNYSEALKYHLACLKIKESIRFSNGELVDKLGVATSYNNIGNAYFAMGNYEESLKNHVFSLKIKIEISAKHGIAQSYNNIGGVYQSQAEREKNINFRDEKYDLALTNYYTSLKIEEEIGNKAGIASSCINIGNVLLKKGKYIEANQRLRIAKDISTEIGQKEYLKDAYHGLMILDSTRNNYKGAYENHRMYILYSDSLDNEETRKKTIQSQMTYDFEKKEAVANAEHKKELEKQELVASEKNRKQKVVIIFVVCGLLVVLVFAGFIFRSLRITRKQKDIIEKQKNLVEIQKLEVEQQKLIVEEHQKAIIDSITYAKRIQKSLLPTDKYIERNLIRLKTKSNEKCD